MLVTKKQARLRRHARVRSRITGNSEIPRVSVYRSNKNIYVQVIDDAKSVTLFGMSDSKLKGTKTEKALALGKQVAEKMGTLKVKSALFDRGGYKYHGRVEAVAKGLREGGLKI